MAGDTTDSSLRIHHPKYYLQDGIIFLVEDCLFKVPRYMLENASPIFSSMFSMPSGRNDPEGQTDAKPIHLSHTSLVDFEHLMELLYPLSYHALRQPETLDECKWTSILRLANKWEMVGIRKMAIKNLEQILPSDCFSVEKILLGREFDYPLWIKTGFAGLCLRTEPLSKEEGVQLGIADIVKYATAREQVRTILQRDVVHKGRHGPSSPTTIRISDVETNYVDNWAIKQVIDDIFINEYPPPVISG